MFLAAKEASSLLGVSIQTIRNWDENGYLRASRTAGGHRRYLIDDIKSLMLGESSKKNRNIVCSWESNHEENLEILNEQEGEKDPRAKACGGFTKSQIGLLLKNQDTAHDVATKKLNENLDFFYELASSMSAPYLFRTKVLKNPTDLFLYHAMRKHCIGHEIEVISAMTHPLNYNFFDREYKSLFEKIVKEVDEELISDVVVNASHTLTCNQSNIDDSIDLIINGIDESTNTKEPKIVIFPPEMAMNKNGLMKLNNNLKKQMKDFSCDNYDTFVSRLIPENKILVAVKSNDKFDGYVFCPYMIMCHYEEKNRIMMRYGKKLLRSGSLSYGVITVE